MIGNKNKMMWICKHFNCNSQKIEDYDVLEYAEARIKKLKKESKCLEEFSKELNSRMMSIYWSRCEYELIIRLTEDERVILEPWAGCYNPKEAEIDVTDDKTFDWKEFAALHLKRQIFKDSAKIDIYEQLRYRWNEFVSYCWNYHFKYERKKKICPKEI